jgi:hypothetical protein
MLGWSGAASCDARVPLGVHRTPEEVRRRLVDQLSREPATERRAVPYASLLLSRFRMIASAITEFEILARPPSRKRISTLVQAWYTS